MNYESKLDTSSKSADSLGLKGGSKVFSTKLLKFIDLKNSCFMISSSPSLVPNLLDGSFSSNYQKLNYNIKYLRYKVLAFIAHLYFMSLRIREINWLLSD